MKRIEKATEPLNRRIEALESKIVNELDAKLNDLVSEKVSRENELMNSRVQTIELKIDLYESHMGNMELKMDDAEQYSRRACLRIYGIPSQQNEAVGDCVKKVLELFKEINVTVTEEQIDRAHRIGRKTQEKDGSCSQAIIVKFCSWKERTAVYRARKELKGKNTSIQLDLTSWRARLLSDGKARVKDIPEIEFVFVDINCRMGLKVKVGGLKFFSDLEELETLIREIAQ